MLHLLLLHAWLLQLLHARACGSSCSSRGGLVGPLCLLMLRYCAVSASPAPTTKKRKLQQYSPAPKTPKLLQPVAVAAAAAAAAGTGLLLQLQLGCSSSRAAAGEFFAVSEEKDRYLAGIVLLLLLLLLLVLLLLLLS